MRAADLSEISQLSIPERILLLEDLWDSIASHNADLPVPESHHAELDRRLTRHIRSPGDLLSLEDLQQKIEKGNKLSSVISF